MSITVCCIFNSSKATAIEFGKLGIDLFLMDYNGTLLEKTVAELKKQFPAINIKSKAMDLSTIIDEKVYIELSGELDKLKIGILFNCAGIAEYKVFRFCDNTHKELTTMNNINASVPLLLYKAVLIGVATLNTQLFVLVYSPCSWTPH